MPVTIRHILLASFFYAFLVSSANGQCVISGPSIIPDDGVLTLNFFVSGLTDTNLSSPTQGVCGLSIDFMHEYLGDITMTLISPSGQSITLIGPPTTAISSTNLSRWNIGFVPCGSVAMPDAGFTGVWNNVQAWQAFASYSGTYHPFVGCLEDFNSGSANGLWTLIIEDHDPLQTGTVATAELIFCNPNGLECDCEPNAGSLMSPSLQYCEGDIFNTSVINVDFAGNEPSPLLYNYQYVLTSGGAIISEGPSIVTPVIEGNYEICGLSYLTSDDATVQSLLSTGDLTAIQNAINSASVCATITPECLAFTVQSMPDTIPINRLLCEGQGFTFGGQTYTVPGTYHQTHDGPGMCDTIFRIQISQSTLSVDINPPGLLGCASGDIVLDAIVSGGNGNVTYQWTTSTGNIIGAADGPQVTVNQPGLYIVVVADGSCQQNESVMVEADEDFPKVFLEGGTLTCSSPGIDLMPVFFPSNASLQWSGPSGFSSTNSSVNVSIPGTYSLSVMNAAGCITSVSVNVGIDTATHPVDILIAGKDCINQYAVLYSPDVSNISIWDWTRPDGTHTNASRPQVTSPGLYQLDVIFSNGCVRSSAFNFDGDFTLPDVNSIQDDTLNCNETIPLTLISSTPGATYQWIGPSGLQASQSVINVTETGTYYGSVHAPNGCTSQIEVEIYKGSDIFNFDFFSDTLDCNTDTVTIGVIAPEVDLFYWVNVPGADTINGTIDVTMGGSYSVIMVDTHSNCSITTTIPVHTDFRYTSFGYTATPITCDNPFSNLAFVPLAGFVYTTVHWEFPDGTIVPGPVAMSNQSGEHKLIADSHNGCFGTWRIHLPFDTVPPTFFLSTDPLDCNRQGQIETVTFDPLTSISWTGPGMFSSVDFNPMVTDTGLYTAIGTGANGCSSDVSVYVEGDFTPPEIQVANDTLDCISFLELTPISIDSLISFRWLDAMGQLIGSDSVIEISEPGNYSLLVEGLNHCFNTDSFSISPPVYPAVEIISDTITCAHTMAQLSASTDIPNGMFVWSLLDGTVLSTDSLLQTSELSPIEITVTGANGCATTDTTIVPADTIAPNAIIDQIGEVRCQEREFILDGSGSGPQPLNYQWSVISGNIDSDPGQSAIQARDTGLYRLVVTNPVNGCQDQDSTRVTEHPESIRRLFLNIIPAACSGESSAQIHIVAIEGGVVPITSRLDGGLLQNVGLFQNLSPGSHHLEVIDAEGCTFDTLVTIDPTDPFFIDAGPDQEIYLGETVLLSGMSDISLDQVAMQYWDSLNVQLCADCQEIEASPKETTVYAFTVQSVTGCVATDELTVFVIEKGKVYVPNVFSPNGDGINDEMRIYPGAGIEKVLKWIIYDRWGDAVYGRTDFLPNDPSVYWDGRASTGETVNPAVFPWILEVELINGLIEIYHGTITVIR